MKLFFDMEFTGLHQKTTPISLGIVTESDDNGYFGTFYAEFTDFDRNQLDEWLMLNVIRNLRFGRGLYFKAHHTPVYSMEMRESIERIAKELKNWLYVISSHEQEPIEFWGDCLSYDWVLLNQLWGGAISKPQNVYYIPFDICTLFKMKKIDPDINREDFAFNSENVVSTKNHNALFDATIIMQCYKRLMQ